MITRAEVEGYLVWLADQPDGVNHRAWLFHAALLIRRDASTVIVDKRHAQESNAAYALSCVESPKPVALIPSEPPVLTFPTVGTGGKTWALTQSKLDLWTGLYPGVDVLAECRKALGWLDANPSKRKTAGGMARFLTAWLSRATDRDVRAGSSPYQKPTQGQRMQQVMVDTLKNHGITQPPMRPVAPARPGRALGE